MNSPPKYSIVIATYNHCEDLLKPCLESILAHTDMSRTEVIVVANGCKDNTEEYVQSLKDQGVNLISFEKPLGYALANNSGLYDWGRKSLGYNPFIPRGEYVILLNDDTVLLDQPKHQWIKYLEEPFLRDPDMGLTGPFKQFSPAANHDFLIFFCVMIHRKVFQTIGYLDETFTTGGGEDTDFCIRAMRAGFKIAQVPSPNALHVDTPEGYPVGIGEFPIWHKGHKTLKGVEGYHEVFTRNNEILAFRYNNQHKFGNGWERHVFDAWDVCDGLRHANIITRYKFAAENLKGKRVLEIGCSSGYAKKFLPPDIDYTGIDYDAKVVELAKASFEDEHYKYHHMDVKDIPWDEWGHFDTIIAFEFLEHVHDGKELAQSLKEHCDCLLVTTPLNETPGLLGPHHVLHRLSPNDFPGFDFKYILAVDGSLKDSPDGEHGVDLMVGKWERGKTYVKKVRVLACVCTKDRYDILPLALQALSNQTVKPEKILICDDGEQRDLRKDKIYKHIFAMLDAKGIGWEVAFTPRKGQQYGHHLANLREYDFVWRVDDDEVPDHDVLEKLLSHAAPDVGAVGGAVITPGGEQKGGTGKIEDIYHTPSVQWARGEGVVEVDHLYSSFIYRPRIASYPLELSPVAHREETIFTYMLKQSGYRLLVDRSAVTYHYRQETGGIRSHTNEFFYEHDEKVFAERMEGWGIRLINLDVGMGDHLVFLHILPALKRRYRHLIIGCAYPDVFTGQTGVRLIPCGASQQYCKDNVYKWMSDRNWSKSILEAYMEMYHVTQRDIEEAKVDRLEGVLA